MSRGAAISELNSRMTLRISVQEAGVRVDTERPGEKAAVMVHKVRKYSHCCTSKSNPILLTDFFFHLIFGHHIL